MKKYSVVLLAAVLMLSLLGCDMLPSVIEPGTDGETAEPAQTETLPTEAPADAAVPETLEPYTPVDISELLPYACDIDGNGVADTVEIAPVADDYDPYTLIVTMNGGEPYSMETYMMKASTTTWLCDMDGDGIAEIYACGDTGSDDFVTYAWRCTDGAVTPVAISDGSRSDVSYLDGSLEAFDGDIFKIGTELNLLGTYGGFRPYQYQPDGTIAPIPDTLWDSSECEYSITSTRDISVIWIDENGETAGTLPAGSVITLTGTDAELSVWFTDAEGHNGRIDLEKNTDSWGFLVDGVPEEECFSDIRYAG